jgi:diguanylate cyclase (GGDEF)-like protein
MFNIDKLVQQSIEKCDTSFRADIHLKSASIVNHPVRLTVYLIATIFFAEAIVMFILNLLPPVVGYKEGLLDSSLLTIIIIPILYYLVYKPFRLHLTIRKEQENKLITISFTDELTGLYNRRGFFNLAGHQLKISNRQKLKVFMMYLDVDNFKEINDSFGHDEGDNALIDIANILKQSFRESDIIARIGGDEFVVFPIETSEESVNIIQSRLKNQFDTHVADNGTIYKLSVSTGIAYYDPEKPCTIDELLNQTDKLMYKQKKQKQKMRTYCNA